MGNVQRAKQKHKARKRRTIHKSKPINKTAQSAAIVRVAPVVEKPWELNNEQVTLLKNYLKNADASDLELKAYLEVARRYRLGPFKQGQIWFIKRWDKNAVSVNNSKGAYVYTPQTGIYGLLHIAGRDYPDFGSMSEPEFGPIFTHEVEGHKFKAPEWCRVKAFKKGIAEPTVATIYFEEFCPSAWDNARLFWSKMPRAQIEKCAKARALRTAYPDLGGLYIPEEMARFSDDHTESGRQIVSGVPTGGSHEAAVAVAQRKIAEARQKPIEAEIVQEEAPVPQPDPSWPTITIDWTTEASPIITGDAELFKPLFDAYCKWGADGFWHTEPRHAERIRQASHGMKFRLEEIMPKSSPVKSSKDTPGVAGAQSKAVGSPAQASAPAKSQRKETNVQPPAAGAARKTTQSASVEPQLVRGVIERVFVTIKGNKSMAVVTLKTEDGHKREAGCWDKDMYELLDKGKGKLAEVVMRTKGQYTDIIGLQRIGDQEFMEGKVKVIQNSTREAGGRTLFGS